MTESESRSKTSSGKSALVFATVLVLALGGGLGAMHWLGQRGSETGAAAGVQRPETLRPLTGTYLEGGRPKLDGPARDVFFSALPDFVVALDSWGRDSASVGSEIRADLEESLGAVMTSARKAAMSAQAIERLQALLDACLEAAVVDEGELDAAADEFTKRILSLNDSLATAGLGFFVDGEMLSRGGTRSVLLFTFEVHQVVLYRSGGHDVRTLRLRRLDNLNWKYSLLGFTSPQRRDAVVLDNKVEEHLLELLPLLAEDSLLDPFDLPLEDTYTDWYTETRKRAVRVVATELGKAGEHVAELADLIARRHDIYGRWNELLESRQMSINYPSRLEVEWKYRRQMEGLATHSDMDKLDKIQKALGGKKMRGTFALAQDLFSRSVERHETQHRLDLAELYRLPLPEELGRYVGELPNGYRGGSDLASSAVAEMSAYLSELARDPLTPRTNLTLLARYLLNRGAWGMGESYAALVIFEGLAAELGIDHEPLVVSRRIDRAVVAQLYMAYTALDPDTLQDASMTLWARYFQTDLPVLELIAR
ncbi:MAG: hypothetical protein GY811_22060 [Myxococcales bacterium]|nr:hypothetical protein [Myxococcales bacterium]